MLAILPAGGRATRFGGIFKELLPIGQHEYLLSNAIQRSVDLGATRAVVITNKDKATAHAGFLERHITPNLPVTLTVRREEDAELWDGLRAVLPFCEERNLMVLPDTTWSCQDQIPEGVDLAFGAFITSEPHRFSVLDRGSIHTKRTDLPRGHRYRWAAWGCVYWSKRVADFWLAAEYPDYDRAFEDAMRVFGYSTFGIDDYNDLGTWEAYQRFVRGTE